MRKTLRRLLRQALAVLSVGAAVLVTLAVPAQAVPNPSAHNCGSYGSGGMPGRLQLCTVIQTTYLPAPAYAHVRFDMRVSIGPAATSADHCIMTGWVSVRGFGESKWDTPREIRGCDPAIGTNIEYKTRILDTDSAGRFFTAHGCLTLTWDDSDYYWQECFSGDSVSP
ncbi:hypothetical protein [Paractinoplanes atraurantiacus]|uniref:Secreted protein n=1 Tax=Paractinoplanes atraurantiacus TaxID=1036182 RepID=A0A285HG72_9ACTN|nr:hypothetical protein [Actinoplanes atraurantiacus]SNY34715.1 hypothetical protein SAMN05421748_104326 [Actinoplanes atraurantiacus]